MTLNWKAKLWRNFCGGFRGLGILPQQLDKSAATDQDFVAFPKSTLRMLLSLTSLRLGHVMSSEECQPPKFFPSWTQRL